MSQSRLIAKLRGQDWFRNLTAWLEDQGIGWRVENAHSRGHPWMHLDVPGVGPVSCVIPCTPRRNGATTEIAIARARWAIARARAGLDPQFEFVGGSIWTPERIACLSRGVNPLAGIGGAIQHSGTREVGTRQPTAR